MFLKAKEYSSVSSKSSGSNVVFEFDAQSCELRKAGKRICYLSPQSAVLLKLLAIESGRLVTKGEIVAALWPEGSLIVDCEGRVRELIKGLRSLFCDSVENPRFIENVPRKGYRFIGVILDNPPSEECAVQPHGARKKPPAVPVPPLEPPLQDSLLRKPPLTRFWFWVLAATGTGLLVLLAPSLLRKTGRSVLRPIQMELLWHGPSVARLGDVSRDGSVLCYADGKTEDLGFVTC